MGKSGKKRGGCAWQLLKAAAACLLFAIAAIAALVVFVEHVKVPAITVDVSPYLSEDAARLVENKTVSVSTHVTHSPKGGLRVSASGRLLDWYFSSITDLHFGFSGVRGEFSAKLTDTDIRLSGDFTVSSANRWNFYACVPETRLSSDDNVLGPLLQRLELSSVSNIACSGSVAVEASGECTDKVPVPVWNVKGSLKGADVSLVADDVPVEARNIRLRFGARGIADRSEMDPLFPRADSLVVSGIAFTNVFASVRSAGKAYLVTEAGAGCAGGELRLYSLFLNPESLSAGATVFVDEVEAGEVLSHVSGFSGEATGHLSGKMTFFLKDAAKLRIRDISLFSSPGETGTIKMADGQTIVESLAVGGLPDDMRRNLSMALANLDYSVLRLRLRKSGDAGSPALSLMLKGNASHGGTTVPVNLDITFRGDIDQLINTGIKLKRIGSK